MVRDSWLWYSTCALARTNVGACAVATLVVDTGDPASSDPLLLLLLRPGCCSDLRQLRAALLGVGRRAQLLACLSSAGCSRCCTMR